MKLNTTHLLAFIWACVMAFLLFLTLTSCDVSKRAVKAHNKAERLGYVYKCEPTTITLRDTIKGKDGKDSIVEVLVKVPCPKVEPPKTKWEIRHMAKRERDSMKHVENVLKLRNKILEDSINGLVQLKKQDTKQAKQTTKQIDDIEDTKQAESWETYLMWGFFICMVIGLVIALIKYRK